MAEKSVSIHAVNMCFHHNHFCYNIYLSLLIYRVIILPHITLIEMSECFSIGKKDYGKKVGRRQKIKSLVIFNNIFPI